MGSAKKFGELTQEGMAKSGLLGPDAYKEAYKDSREGSSKPTEPGVPAAHRMAGDAVSAVTDGRQYRNVGKARFRRDP